MKAIILAAGRGSRMKHLTEEKPKCLVQLHGKTLLDWQIESLHIAGITEIAIVTGYKRQLLARRDLVEIHNERWAETNMVSSLACANEWLEADSCIVSYSDIFYSPLAVESLISCSAELAITYDPNWRSLWVQRFGDPLLDAETFRISQESTLLEIGNKPNSLNEIQGQYMGLLRFTPHGWHAVQKVRAKLSPEQSDRMHMTGTLQKIIDSQIVSILAIPYKGKWGEVDSESDLLGYQSQSKLT